MATVDVVHGRDPDAPPHGGFASRLAVAASRVIPVGDELDDVTLAQVEPVTVSVHAVERSGMRPGELVVVIGAGPVGLVTLQCARAMGAAEVVVVEPDPGRGAMAARLGAAAVTTPEAAPDVVAERSGGIGADVVFDCAGGADALASAVAAARRGGTVCLVGLDAGPVPIEPSEWLRREITVRAVVGYVRRDFDRALDLLAGGLVVVDPLHTSTVGLDDLAGTFASLAAGDPSQLKVLVEP